MIKKNTLITVFIAGAMVASPLFASNSFHKLMHLNQSVSAASNMPEKPSAKYEDQDYTDFSGNWSGSCSLPDDMKLPIEEFDSSIQMRIEHDSSYFNIDGLDYRVGAVTSESEANSFEASYSHSSIEWKNDMSTLALEGVSYVKPLLSFISGESQAAAITTRSVVLSLNDKKLMVNMQFKFFKNIEQEGDVLNISCSLSKDK